MVTQPSASPVPEADTVLDDILATLDEVEHRLHEALALSETSVRVCQQAVAATMLLRSRLASEIYGRRVYAHLEHRQGGHVQQAEVAAGAPGNGRAELLTTREREVIDLIAAGHSNRQIAEILYLSPRTIERHIANLYLKLDVHSKAEATAWALVHGLVGRDLASNGSVFEPEDNWRPENYICRLHSSTDA